MLATPAMPPPICVPPICPAIPGNPPGRGLVSIFWIIFIASFGPCEGLLPDEAPEVVFPGELGQVPDKHHEAGKGEEPEQDRGLPPV